MLEDRAWLSYGTIRQLLEGRLRRFVRGRGTRCHRRIVKLGESAGVQVDFAVEPIRLGTAGGDTLFGAPLDELRKTYGS